MKALPRKTREFQNHHFDSTVWNDFAFRDGDIVIAVPNCARCAAIGYSLQSGVPLDRGFTTNHYAGRSFILPEQHMRDLAVKIKLNVIKDAVRKPVRALEGAVSAARPAPANSRTGAKSDQGSDHR